MITLIKSSNKRGEVSGFLGSDSWHVRVAKLAVSEG